LTGLGAIFPDRFARQAARWMLSFLSNSPDGLTGAGRHQQFRQTAVTATIDGRRMFKQGFFRTEEQAVEAYKRWSKELHGGNLPCNDSDWMRD